MGVQEQRLRFVIAASGGGSSMTSLCWEFGISRPTGYLWLERFRADGADGISEQSRRPRRSPTRIESGIEQRIVALRQQRPDWGARKLKVLLGRESLQVPASTVHRVLLRQGLVRVEDGHEQAPGRFQREQPNQLWQMDFKSPKGWNRPVGPLSVLDDASRYALALEGTWTTRGEAVQQRLEAVFRRCGLPEAMLMDHGTPWWHPQSAGGWTQLSVWLMKQGIRLYFSGIRHPQTQGKVERFHGALELARRRRGLPEPALQQRWLDDFREEYNHLRPHEALAMKTPASCWHPSTRLFQNDPPEWVYPDAGEVLRLDKEGRLPLGGRRWPIAKPLAGERVQLLRVEQRLMVLYQNTLVRELPLVHGGSTMVEPPRTRTKV